jgi:acylphosphatase
VIARRVVVHGRVQGVFFRDRTHRHARAEGVTGWVRNNPDGTVEIHAEGERAAVEQLIAFAREGPPLAQVERVDVEDIEPEGLEGFEVR